MKKEKPLKDVLKKIITNLEKREEEELDIINTWERVAGEKAAKHTKATFLKTKKLIVVVSSSPWLYKLTLEKRELIKKFNQEIGENKKIKEIQFKIGQV